MADDWQPGNLALCVNNGALACPECRGVFSGRSSPPKGSCNVVSGISRCGAPGVAFPGLEDDCMYPVLFLQGGYSGFAHRFRKIRPHTPDAEDAETIRLLTGNPAKVPV